MAEEETKREHQVTRDQYRFYLVRASVIVLAAIVVIIFYFCVKRYDGIAEGLKTLNTALAPIIIGFVTAFLLNPIMKALEKAMLPYFLGRTKNETKTRHRVRTSCSLISLAILIALVAFFLSAVIPQIVSTVNDLINNINDQIVGVLDWADKITGGRFHRQLSSAKEDKNITNALNSALTYVQDYLHLGSNDDVVNTLTSWGASIGKGIFNGILGMIVSVYVLVEKDVFKSHTKKLIYGIFKTSHANVVLDVGRKTKEVFYGFIVGKIIDSLIIGVICYICMLILRFPYPVLCSVIIGVTNIIPVFGPYIGAVPTVILVFMNNPVKGIYMLIFVIILQQIDGNIIGPKILGDYTGITPLLSMISIILGSALFGFVGLLISVPVCAVLYSLAKTLINRRLEGKGLPTDSEAYDQTPSRSPGAPPDESGEKQKKPAQNKPGPAELVRRLQQNGKKNIRS